MPVPGFSSVALGYRCFCCCLLFSFTLPTLLMPAPAGLSGWGCGGGTWLLRDTVRPAQSRFSTLQPPALRLVLIDVSAGEIHTKCILSTKLVWLLPCSS